MDNIELNNFKKFLDLNIKCKNILYDMAFDKRYISYNNYIIKYCDIFYKQFKDLKNLVLDMARLYFKKDFEYLNMYFKKLEKVLINLGTNIDKINAFYNIYLSEMSDDFVKKVGENCKGYYICPEIDVKEAKTINEIIHYMHSYVINNDTILQNIPVVVGQEIEYEKKWYLRGYDTEMGRTLYNNTPEFLKNTIFDIVSYNENNCLLMARNIGHALTVEIQKERDKYFVKYFIPKIYDAAMVNNLPGINSIKEGSSYARGVFYIEQNNFPKELYQFMEKVPTDAVIARRT